jgi:hypothetical protein
MSSNRQKQRESYYNRGETFILHQRWVWNCLPASQEMRDEPLTKDSGRQVDNEHLAHTAHENEYR